VTLLAGTAWRATGRVLDVARRLPGVDAALTDLEGRGAEALRAADALTDTVLRVIVRKVVQAALLEVDVTAVVRDHVDLDTIAEGIDVERIVDRVDVRRVIDRVNVDEIAARVDIAPILDRVDIDAVAARVNIGAILDRVDVDAVAERIDVGAVIGRVDLIGLANTVIEGVDLPSIIRESTESMSTEAVRGVRSQGMRADDAVSGFVGKLFGRGPAEPADVVAPVRVSESGDE